MPVTTTCTRCGRALPPGVPGPCPACGGAIRHVVVLEDASLRLGDQLGMTHDMRDGDVQCQVSYLYDDHPRDNPVRVEAHLPGVDAHVGPDRQPHYDVHMPAPTGEAGTLETCRILVQHLNQFGGQWDEPIDLNACPDRLEGGVDCEATDRTDSSKKLEVQVTRVANSDLWRQLGRHGRATDQDPGAPADTDKVVATIYEAIRKKAEHTPKRQRAAITLALDATATAWFAFEPFVRCFRARHGSWARELGFASIWAVGPMWRQTWRIDADPS
jgi:hypothetical protein